MSKNYDFQEMLRNAITNDDEITANMALANGADANGKIEGYPILALACMGGHANIDIIKLLLDYGADVNTKLEGYSLCIFVSTDKNIELLKLLIDREADLNEMQPTGRTLLSELVRCDKVNAVKVILSVSQNDMTPRVNVNKLNNDGSRAIDCVRNKNETMIKLLRENGSVEPKTLITVDSSVQKLIIRENVAPDSSDLGNKQKTLPILNKMLTKFPLTEREIDDTIAWFKTTQDFTTYPSEWSVSGNVMTVLDVINKLSTMRDVQDRLPSWDFKKVLGTIIHIAKDDEDLTNNLIYTLSQIKMCNLGKLINLLYVIQDKILESDKVDYSTMEFSEFEPVIKAVAYELYLQMCGENKAGFALIKWLNDNLNEKNITGPEEWSLYTQKVQGIFAKCFMKQANIQVNIESYHFTEGLQNIFIKNIIDKITHGAFEAESAGLKSLQTFVQEGAAMLAEEYFDKIVQGSVKVSDIEGAYYTPDLFFGNLEGLTPGAVQSYHERISEKYGDAQGKLFLRLLSDFTLDYQVKEYISVALNENNSEQPEELIAVANEHAIADLDTSLQGNIDQTDHNDFV